MVDKSYSQKFWEECEEYHEMVENFEKGIEEYHPNTVSSRRMCVCLDYCNWCGWAGTSVEYYRYNGTSIKNM